MKTIKYTYFVLHLLIILLLYPDMGQAAGDIVLQNDSNLQEAIHNAAANGVNVCIPPGVTVTIDNHIYLYGRTSLYGGGTIKIDGNPEYGFYWINCGIKAYGATPANKLIDEWNGSIRDITFKTTKNATMGGRLINVHRCLHARIENCVFDLCGSGTASIGPIGCYNNAYFCNPPRKDGLWITGNRIIAEQDWSGSEGIGVGNAKNVWIVDNLVEGVGDDVIAAHTCTDLVIKGNICRGIDGRLFLSNVVRAIMANNSHTHTTKGGCGLIWVYLENERGNPPPADLTLIGNRLYHHEGMTNHTYGIRLRGARRCSVIGNAIVSIAPGFGHGIRIVPQLLPEGWQDPEGIEIDNKVRVRDMTIVGNRAPRITEGAIGSWADSVPGPSRWAGNHAEKLESHSTDAD